jgi:hypothetical protein
VVRQVVVEPLGRVIDVGIHRILRREIGRHPRQARCVGRKIKQGDRRAFEIRHLHAGGEKFRGGIVRRNLPAQDHVGKQQRREHLGDRAYLENRVTIERAIVRRTGLPIDRDAAPVTVEKSGNDAQRFTPDIHPLLEDGGNILLR